MKNTEIKSKKGIKIIVLAVIVILLLILSGVAINSLTGKNETLIQEGDSKTNETESIKRGEVNGNGEVSKNSEIRNKIISNPTAYYGKKVTNYKDDGKTYRIFYVDKENYFGDGVNTIYLKADYSDTKMCSTSYDSNETRIKEMNPLWAEKRGNSEKDWNNNEKAAAWLCDPSEWTVYCDTEKANYAMGGPSVEMYVKSYNQAYSGVTDDNVYTLGAIYNDTAEPGYIYTLNGAKSTISYNDYFTGNDSLDYTNYNSMYCGRKGEKNGDWWLASPSAEYSIGVCVVEGTRAHLAYHFYNGSFRVSPIVSLKSTFIPEVEE